MPQPGTTCTLAPVDAGPWSKLAQPVRLARFATVVATLHRPPAGHHAIPQQILMAGLGLVSLTLLVTLGAIAARAGGASMVRGATRIMIWGSLVMAAPAPSANCSACCRDARSLADDEAELRS